MNSLSRSMSMLLLILGVGLLLSSSLPAAQAKGPEQLMVSLSGKPDEMVITWVTFINTTSVVQYGTDNTTSSGSVAGTTLTFVDPASLHIVRYIHNALLTGLKLQTLYYYRVGDGSGRWSEIYSFKTLQNGDAPVRMIVYGDFGLINSQSFDMLSQEAQARSSDIILHVGDYAYDLHTNNGTLGDQWLNFIQPFSATIPYMGKLLLVICCFLFADSFLHAFILLTCHCFS